jgi:NADH-quinone oxidoreductase subunit I
VYTRDELLVDDQGMPKKQPWEDWRPGDERNTSAWMRATSPNGSAAYEGKVAWSGELGFGVRPPEQGQSDAPAPEGEIAAEDAATQVGERPGDEH